MTRTTLGLAALALLVPAGVSLGAVYTKTGAPGNLPGNADVTTGVGDLTEIDGTFSTNPDLSYPPLALVSNPDLYLIDITDLFPFSATTVGTTGDVPDTRLFLFDFSGRGIYFNDDAASAGATILGGRAALPNDYLPIGQYYLGVSTQGVQADSTDGEIFPDNITDPTVDPTGVYGPTGPGGSMPLSSWNITADDMDTGSYTIDLTGATFAAAPAVPEASPAALLVLGTALMALTARRRARLRA